MKFEIEPIAVIKNDFNEKFGVPRQSGLVNNLSSVVFEPKFRISEALKGIDGFSHIWLIWSFSESIGADFKPSVRPPRLGGNEKMGVFATRSPFRPNNLGLSCVELVEVKKTKNEGDVLIVRGADLKNGTPIFDIKPYIKMADSKPEASLGFAQKNDDYKLKISVKTDAFFSEIPKQKQGEILAILEQDPRPQYQEDPERIYGVSYGDFNVKFRVVNKVLEILDIEKL